MPLTSAREHLLNQQINAKLATDGIYGPQTAAAVEALRRKVRLPVDGMVSPVTYPKLIVTVEKGSKGPALSSVRHNLRFAYGCKSLMVSGTSGNGAPSSALFAGPPGESAGPR